MKILSLFDGMCCGMLAFMRADVPVDRYVAYEIDKYAVQVSSHNFPMIEQKGDVFQADFTEYRGFDAIVGGSPCTYWSIAQKSDKRETEAHGIGWELFQQYVRAIKEAEPRFFIYENNKSMANSIKEEISATFGFEPIMIDSALVSAQRRQRYYWVGIRQDDGTYRRANIDQPADRGILLKDVLDDVVGIGKAYSSQTTLIEDTVPINPTAVNLQVLGRKKNREGDWERVYEAREDDKASTITSADCRLMVAEPVAVAQRTRENDDGTKMQRFEASGPKSNCLTTVQNNALVAEPIGGAVLNVNPSGKGMNGEVMHTEGKSRCLTTNKGEGPKIITKSISMTGDFTDRHVSIQDKAFCLAANPSSDMSARVIIAMDDDRVEVRGMSYSLKDTVDDDRGVVAILDMPGSHDILTRVTGTSGKSPTITASGGGNTEPKVFSSTKDVKSRTKTPIYVVKNGKISFRGKTYPIKLPDGEYIIRKLTVSECKRLQTIPEWYDMSVISNAQAYKCLGNGWTVEVIAHLIERTLTDMEKVHITQYQATLF